MSDPEHEFRIRSGKVATVRFLRCVNETHHYFDRRASSAIVKYVRAL
ncbi:MAG: hypothetical protein Q4G24_16120 [Paracoccus sp. (in: a-proteobacteria)]|nr:hypothetical protein [Paracoccus sp. (in: a-proteobacteria)]MDO5622973.1 hypothetical protein [Paracoccus sp. (in: a-proteobacteria)]